MNKKIKILLCLILFSSITFAQQKIIGKILDEKGIPLEKVIITEVNTNNSTQSEVSGNFSITLRGNFQTANLKFSKLGFENVVLKVSESMQVVMKESLENLQEVSVTALGISKKTKTLSYSVTQIGGDKFTESRTANLGNALSGKVAGVLITPPASGVAGSSRVIIRGGSSLSGNDQPLYVINGVPIESANNGNAGLWGGNDEGDGLSAINPDDIESISVLKGNTAASLYGARAANGVIIITTKSGKAKQGMGVAFNSNTTFDKAVDLTNFQNKYGSGFDGKVATSKEDALNNVSLNHWGIKFDASSVIQVDGVSRPYSNLGQTLNDFYRVGVNSTNTIAFSGGNDNANYRFSFADLNAEDILPNSTFKRQTLNFNVNSKLSEKLVLQFSGQYTKQNALNRPRLSDLPANANFQAIFKQSTLPFDIIKGATGVGDNADGTEFVTQGNIYSTNPYWATYKIFRQDISDRFLGNVLLKYNFNKWFYIQGRIGTDFTTRDNASSEVYGTAYKLKGGYSETNVFNREDNYDFIFGFNKNFNDISVDAFVGGNSLYRSRKLKGGNGNDLVIPFLNSLSNIATPGINFEFSESAINSIYGAANFGYKNFLYLNFTGREDEFSTLAKGLNKLFYPSVGLSFIISEAIKLPNEINLLKLRTSWAQTGGGAPDPYALLLTYGLNGSHNGGNLGVINNGSIPNQSLQPYTSTEFEVGFDLRVLKNRLGIDFALYNRKTTNDILATGISSTSGYSSTIINIGELTNKGFEIQINATPIQTNTFQWNLSLNFSNNISEVVNLGKNSNGENIEQILLDESRLRNGERIGQLVGKPLGYILGTQQKKINGRPVYDSVTGAPIKDNTTVPLAPGRHPISGGLSNSFTYKNWKLDFLIDYRFGAKVVSATNYFAYNYGRHENTLIGRESVLNIAGVDQSGKERTWAIKNDPNSASTYYIDNYYKAYASITENILYDASYIKFRQFSLGYSFPKKMLGNIGKVVQNLTLSLVARNLLILWSNIPNIDPESGYTTDSRAQGLEFMALPQTRSIGFNLSIGL